MGKITLYGFEMSPPVRTVLLTLKALNLPYEFVKINTLAKEHLKPEYLKMNPQHTVPTLEDDGHYIWDSHAIAAYLVNKYAKSDELYPNDPLKRAVVDQRLHFESSVLFTDALANITRPIWINNETHIPKAKLEKVKDVYNFLEIFLAEHQYIAGDNVTIADLSLGPTVASLTIFLEIDEQKYVKLSAWLKRLSKLPYYDEVNAQGATELGELLKSKNLTFEK